MKYPIIFSLSCLLFATQAQAQTTYPPKEYPQQKNEEPAGDNKNKDPKQQLTPEQKAQKGADHLQKKLGLTEEQKQKVYDLNYGRITKTRAAREKAGADKQAAREAQRKIRTEYDTALNGILTDDQQKTWAQLKADAKARHQAKKGTGKGGKTAPTEEDSEQDLE